MIRRTSLHAALAALALAAACQRSPELVSDHLAAGDKALADGRYTDAIVAYNHAHEVAPQDPRVQRAMMRARAFVMAASPGRIGAEALDDVSYEAAFLLEHEHDKANESVYLTALGNVLARRGDFDGARVKLGEALTSDPLSPVAHAALGSLLLGRNDRRAEARAELEQALKNKPDSREALLGLGQLALADGDAGGAVTRLESALRLGDDFPVRMALGTARLQQQKLAEAAAHFQRAAQLDPKNGDALTSLGQALLAAGQLADAERALRASLQLRPDDATAVALGFTLARAKKPEQALGVFVQVLERDAGDPSALYGAGTASESLARPEQALGYYRRLLALPTDGRGPVLADLRKEALERVATLSARPIAPSTGASASAAPPPKPR
jgi:tetratricopeptide (TPR) repeat protein